MKAETASTETPHGYGVDSDCVCGRNFATVRGLREHLTKMRSKP
jgi:hypothetical protein